MGVALKVVAWLKEQGHDVWHLAERGLELLPDSEIFVARPRSRGS